MFKFYHRGFYIIIWQRLRQFFENRASSWPNLAQMTPWAKISWYWDFSWLRKTDNRQTADTQDSCFIIIDSFLFLALSCKTPVSQFCYSDVTNEATTVYVTSGTWLDGGAILRVTSGITWRTLRTLRTLICRRRVCGCLLVAVRGTWGSGGCHGGGGCCCHVEETCHVERASHD